MYARGVRGDGQSLAISPLLYPCLMSLATSSSRWVSRLRTRSAVGMGISPAPVLTDGAIPAPEIRLRTAPKSGSAASLRAVSAASAATRPAPAASPARARTAAIRNRAYAVG